jgi:hypothetical protein
MMPWLVPVCSREDLKNAVETAGAPLFSGAPIAGLVPGVTNYPFDACAYVWAPGAPLEWVFEFKARSGSYSLADAIRALETKCRKLSTEKYRAMLVGFAGSATTEVRVWLVEDKLRIVLLL